MVNTRNTIPVDETAAANDDAHQTIQSALDGLYDWFGANAFSTSSTGYLSGEKTIDVYSGTYAELVTPNVNLVPTASENLIIRNHTGETPAIDAYDLANGIYIGNLDYVQVIGFTIYDATAENIYTEGDNNVISMNKCYDSPTGTGIILNTSANSTVTNNLVYSNNKFGIRLVASDNAIVKNNTLVNNGNESKGPPLPGIYEPAQLYVQSGTGISVENNIFYALSGSYVYTLKTELGITVSSDYNTYYKNGNTYLVNYNGSVYADLAAWSGNGAGTNDIGSDPKFVTAGSDFHIQSTNGSYHSTSCLLTMFQVIHG